MKILITLILIVGANVCVSGQDNHAQLALHIASKLTDTLGLSNQQRAKIFTINMDLAKQKMNARKKVIDREKIRVEMQQVEEFRDGLYKEVFTMEQYAVYISKKKTLLSTN